MDFTELSDDQLADALGAAVREAERRNELRETGVRKALMKGALRIVHGGLSHAKRIAVDDEIIQPFSGGDPDKED